MSARKPLDELCTGSVNCETEGHVSVVWHGRNWTIRHLALTKGQTKTLRERLHQKWLSEKTTQ